MKCNNQKYHSRYQCDSETSEKVQHQQLDKMYKIFQPKKKTQLGSKSKIKTLREINADLLEGNYEADVELQEVIKPVKRKRSEQV